MRRGWRVVVGVGGGGREDEGRRRGEGGVVVVGWGVWEGRRRGVWVSE